MAAAISKKGALKALFFVRPITKMQIFEKKLPENLVMSEKCSNFARFFAE